MLECINLSFSYGQAKRLNDVSFNFGPGIFGLFGQNGSGKSTLLKVLRGSLPAQPGALAMNGRDILDGKGYVKSQVRKNFGILFQETSSDEKITVYDNLFYASLLMGLDKKKTRSKIEEVLTLSGLSHRSKDQVKKLSGGMRRRLELYRTFLHEPNVVLLDEPTCGLDVEEQQKFHKFLVDYQKKHQALIIMASHSPEELLITDRVLFLAHGKVVADGAPKDLLLSLDYLRLSLKLGDNSRFVPENFSMFDIDHDKKNAQVQGKIYSQHLKTLLEDQALLNNFAGFSIDKPSLADVYANALKGDLHG